MSEIHPGQRWRAAAAPAHVIDVIRQVDDGLWLVRPLGAPIEMTVDYVVSSYELLSDSEAIANG